MSMDSMVSTESVASMESNGSIVSKTKTIEFGFGKVLVLSIFGSFGKNVSDICKQCQTHLQKTHTNFRPMRTKIVPVSGHDVVF